jgi:hypothetical protein
VELIHSRRISSHKTVRVTRKTAVNTRIRCQNTRNRCQCSTNLLLWSYSCWSFHFRGGGYADEVDGFRATRYFLCHETAVVLGNCCRCSVKKLTSGRSLNYEKNKLYVDVVDEFPLMRSFLSCNEIVVVLRKHCHHMEPLSSVQFTKKDRSRDCRKSKLSIIAFEADHRLSNL